VTRVDAALRAARAAGVERLDAHLLLAHVLEQSRAWLLAHGDEVLAPPQAVAYEALVARRAAGEPFAYLVGEREFHGLMLCVSDAVLVPRPDTETLVEWALDVLSSDLKDVDAPALIDLGTGSGAIALALKSACPRARAWAGERSSAALAVARGNAQRLALDVRFAQGDWWAALDGVADVPTFDLVVSNPPYIACDDPHLVALTHEPLAALVAADEGLADLRKIATGAGTRLRPGGWLLFEHGWAQARAVQAILAEAGFVDVATRVDIEGRARCTGGRLRSSSL
jgi:release factor glutamine methyltransferase